ncbi:unnamed protein product [Anisakis simplex]|uniref:Uncharacterized protein n=1 Tax=Anisakis simplex TaxID=6269 RepID=A0A0M3J4E2_ANISI|nr:unnamed protein product [Anisakis simplex]
MAIKVVTFHHNDFRQFVFNQTIPQHRCRIQTPFQFIIIFNRMNYLAYVLLVLRVYL